MAMISVTYADGLIACFDAKYHYKFWRPITAIRAGDTDGNDATVGDPTWTTLLAATPNHTEYPSAHSCITPAAGIVIARFLRGRQRAHLGRHPLPLGGRGRDHDRQEDGAPGARPPLPQIRALRTAATQAGHPTRLHHL
jgi:hypothetical protein